MTALLQASISGLAVGGAYALIALGFSLTFTTTRTLNFAQGDFVSVGAFLGLSAVLLLSGSPLAGSVSGAAIAGWVPLLAILAAAAGMGLIGAALYRLAIRPFAGKPGMSWVMSSIGFGIILRSAGLAAWGPGTVMVPAPFGDGIIRMFGAGVRLQELLVLLTALVAATVFEIVMRRTVVGKAMRAVAHDPATARLMGIPVEAYMTGAFVASSALAGLSGILIAPTTGASLYMGLGIALKGFSSAIVGGLTNPRGCVLGGLLLGLTESWINLWQAQWREIVVFLAVIIVLGLKPSGLWGAKVVEKA
jgi:branched-chain amino acid transport system permease protein